MSNASRFYEILTAAINDFMEHGFDSQERLDKWLKELAVSAREALVSPESLVRMLNDRLSKVYQRSAEVKTLLKKNPGVSQFTIEFIKPKLRAELDRRILASANLIRLNREASIARTLQRFSGWATSIPAGGTDVAKRKQVKQTVRRGIAGLPFEERRVVIDQSKKLTAAINDIVATDGGAIAGRWHHVAEGPPAYQSRPDHVARDGKIYLIRDSWADKKGYVKPSVGYTDDITQPGEEVFCLPGDSKIPFADGVEVAYRRWYSGDLTEIVTTSGKTLRLTPNHPVLTVRGWIAAGQINETDYLVEISDDTFKSTSRDTKSDQDHAVPSISQIFGTLNNSGAFRRIRGLRHQFHGDGADGNVDIVYAARPLTFGGISTRTQFTKKFSFSNSNHAGSFASTLKFFIQTGASAATSIMSRFRPSAMLFWSFFGSKYFVGFFNTSNSAACIKNTFNYCGTTDAVRAGKRQNTFAGFMGATQSKSINNDSTFFRNVWACINAKSINAPPKTGWFDSKDVSNVRDAFPFPTQFVKVRNVKNDSSFSGHVYNLKTSNGAYLADGLIVHNCSCSYLYLYSLSQLPPSMLTAKGKAALMEAQNTLRGTANATA